MKCADVETRAELVMLYSILQKKGILTEKDLMDMHDEVVRIRNYKE